MEVQRLEAPDVSPIVLGSNPTIAPTIANKLRTIPTRVGRTVKYQQVAAWISSSFGELEGVVVGRFPSFGHQPKSAEVGVPSIRFPPALDLEPLAIGFTGLG